MTRYSFSTKLAFGLLVIAVTIGYFSLLSGAWTRGRGGGALQPHDRVEATVDAGLVVAYGRPLPSPYHLEMDGSNVIINGVAYEPRPADQPERPTTVVTDEVRAKVELEQRIVARYLELTRKVMGSLPETVVADEFRNDPLLSGIDVRLAGSGTIILNYRDGQSEHLDLASFVRPQVTDAERAWLQREHFNQLAQILRDGGGIIFGKGYNLLLPARSVAELRRAAARRPLDTVAEQALAGLLTYPQAVADVISSIGSWPVTGLRVTPPSELGAEVREATYRERYFSPCPSWRVTVAKRDGRYYRQASCPQEPNQNQGSREMSVDEFVRYVYIDAYLAKFSQLKLMEDPPSFGADIDAQIARCYQSADGGGTACANSMGVIVVRQDRPSLGGMLDADISQTLESVRYVSS